MYLNTKNGYEYRSWIIIFVSDVSDTLDTFKVRTLKEKNQGFGTQPWRRTMIWLSNVLSPKKSIRPKVS